MFRLTQVRHGCNTGHSAWISPNFLFPHRLPSVKYQRYRCPSADQSSHWKKQGLKVNNLIPISSLWTFVPTGFKLKLLPSVLTCGLRICAIYFPADPAMGAEEPHVGWVNHGACRDELCCLPSGALLTQQESALMVSESFVNHVWPSWSL